MLGFINRIVRSNCIFVICIQVKHVKRFSVSKKRNMIAISWLLLIVGVLESFATEWNTKDYMKREHSLIRPYQGLSISVIFRCIR